MYSFVWTSQQNRSASLRSFSLNRTAPDRTLSRYVLMERWSCISARYPTTFHSSVTPCKERGLRGERASLWWWMSRWRKQQRYACAWSRRKRLGAYFMIHPIVLEKNRQRMCAPGFYSLASESAEMRSARLHRKRVRGASFAASPVHNEHCVFLKAFAGSLCWFGAGVES